MGAAAGIDCEVEVGKQNVGDDQEDQQQMVWNEAEHVGHLVDAFVDANEGCCEESGLVLAHDMAARQFLLGLSAVDAVRIAAVFMSLESQLRDHTGHSIVDLVAETLAAHSGDDEGEEAQEMGKWD
jgi:hypothetical protein